MVAGISTSAPSHQVPPNSRAVSQLYLKSQCVVSSLSKTVTLHVTCDHTRQARLGPDLNLNINLPQSDLPPPPSTPSPKLRILPDCSSDPKSRQLILRGSLFDTTMSLKREADPFIKPDPDAKRVKTEGGDGNFSLSSIPMAPTPAAFAPSATSAVGPKIEGGDRKPLGPVSGSRDATLGFLRRKALQPANKPSTSDFLHLSCHFSPVAIASSIIMSFYSSSSGLSANERHTLDVGSQLWRRSCQQWQKKVLRQRHQGQTRQ